MKQKDTRPERAKFFENHIGFVVLSETICYRTETFRQQDVFPSGQDARDIELQMGKSALEIPRHNSAPSMDATTLTNV